MGDSKSEGATPAPEGTAVQQHAGDELLARRDELTDLILSGTATLGDYGVLARVQQDLDRWMAAEGPPADVAPEPCE